MTNPAFLDRSDRYTAQGRQFVFFFHLMKVSSEQTVGAFTGIRDEESPFYV